ncbi:MAG TPA: MraY family glycosyltransferase [Candidatus Methylomirabilis sp.]|nr:MraY family glycosyltransferase [Candidatus Methylomirabilis sp.]
MNAGSGGFPGKRIAYAALLLLFLGLFLVPVRAWFAEHGGRWLYVLLFSASLSGLLVPPVRAVASSSGVLDLPDPRKQHGQATPLLGGVALFAAFCLSLLANSIFSWDLLGILLGSALLVGVGVADDVRSVPAGLKLAAQVAAAGLVMATGLTLHVVPPALGGWASGANALLTLLWIIGITNAMNFFDGMDGLAAGLGGITALFLGILAQQNHQAFLGWVAAATLGSCLGFLPYNFRPHRPASIFLGDSGATFLGFVLAALAVKGDWAENNPVVALIAPLLIFAIFIYDMVYITVERIWSGKVRSFKGWIEYVGRDHLHHRLEALLGGRGRSVLFIYGMSVSLGLTATVLRHADTRDALLLIAQGVIILVIITILEREGNRRLREVGIRPGGAPGSSPEAAPGRRA